MTRLIRAVSPLAMAVALLATIALYPQTAAATNDNVPAAQIQQMQVPTMAVEFSMLTPEVVGVQMFYSAATNGDMGAPTADRITAIDKAAPASNSATALRTNVNWYSYSVTNSTRAAPVNGNGTYMAAALLDDLVATIGMNDFKNTAATKMENFAKNTTGGTDKTVLHAAG